MEFRVRKATQEDTEIIMNILTDASFQLSQKGIPQWYGTGKPTLQEIESSIHAKNNYVFVRGTDVVGTLVLSYGPEAAYQELTSDSNYVVIHRLAIKSEEYGKGIAKSFVTEMIKIIEMNTNIDSVYIDTHPLNISMKKVIHSLGFVMKGMINLPIENGERIAYEYTFLEKGENNDRKI